jgi:hypothetical protein
MNSRTLCPDGMINEQREKHPPRKIIVLGRPQLLLRVFANNSGASDDLPISRLRCRNPVAYHVFGEARQTKMSE